MELLDHLQFLCLFWLSLAFTTDSEAAKRSALNKESNTDKKLRIKSALERKPRNISGWNVFQRERLASQGKLSPTRYKSHIKELSAEWRGMPPDSKDAYEVQAKFEQEAKRKVQEMPLPAKGQPLSQEEKIVGRSGRKKLSSRRLLHSYTKAESDPAWKRRTQMGDSFLSINQCVSECLRATLFGSIQTSD